ncbi:MAG: hypothetical protein D6744_16795 [Planctomycetota bacterium]|nr:MAG: hypothetical protein D6744_16795 [Planctomycetota bacterium]
MLLLRGFCAHFIDFYRQTDRGRFCSPREAICPRRHVGGSPIETTNRLGDARVPLLNRLLRRIRKSEPPVRLEDCEFAYPYLNWVQRCVGHGSYGRLRRHYTWGVIQAAFVAAELKLPRITVVEFGVAGGNGLIALDMLPERLAAFFPTRIDVVGFDAGAGLPPPQDHRDHPNLWSAGDYRMDADALRKRLSHARLILGDVSETVPAFLASRPAPVGFVAFDLDYYSSTAYALRLLAADASLLLPRVYCYFDDILGFTFNDYGGERLAIREFNQQHADRKISPIYGLRHQVDERFRDDAWLDQMHLAHVFDHPLYGHPDGLVRHGRKPLNATE